MISIKKHIEGFENERLLISELECCYTDALVAIRDSLMPVSDGFVAQKRAEVRELIEEIGGGPGVDVLSEVRGKLKDLMRAYSDRRARILDGMELEIQRMIGKVAEMASTLARHGRSQSSRFTAIARNLESIKSIDDLTEIRKRLTHELTDMQLAIGELCRSSEESAEQLRSEVEHCRRQLANAERVAQIDPLTHAENRQGGETIVNSLLKAASPFSILLFDLNGLHGINARWGHQAGDALLIQFARRLRASIRNGESVCRWGGDEFLVIFPKCGIAQATERGNRLARACEGEYQLTVLGQHISVRISVAHGVAENRPAESLESLLQRADESLYRAKGIRAVGD